MTQENSKASRFFTNGTTVFLAAVLCAFLWGSAFPAIKVGYELFAVAPEDTAAKLLFAGYRFALAGLLTLVFGCITQKKLIFPPKGSRLEIGALGLVFTGMQYFFFYIGLSNTAASKASVINSAGTFFAIILAHFFYKNDKMNPQKAIGCIFGFLGVIVVNLGQGAQDGFSLTGEGFMLMTALTFAFGSLWNKRASQRYDPVTVTGYQLFAGGAALVLGGLLGGGQLSFPGFAGMGLFLYLAALSSVAFVLWSMLLRYNPVGKVTVFQFLIPVFGTLLSAIFLKENIFRLENLIALILVCVGIYAVYARPLKKKNNAAGERKDT